METTPSKDTSATVKVWLLIVCALPLLYILSVGPVVVMIQKRLISQGPMLERLYAPMGYVVERNTTVQKVFWQYCAMWLRLCGETPPPLPDPGSF